MNFFFLHFHVHKVLRPRLRSWASKGTYNLIELIKIVFSVEKKSSKGKLSKNAAY